MRLRLRTQILLIALLPTALVAFVIGGYLLMTRVADLHESQIRLGETIAEHLAPASEFAVLSGDRRVLERLTNQLVQKDNVWQVSIYDAEDRLLAEATSSLEKSDVPGWIGWFYPGSSERLLFEAPIEIADDPIGDFEGLFSDPETAATNDAVIGRVVVELSSQPLQSRQAEVLRFGSLLILVGLIIAFALATRAGLNIVRPINNVVQAFRQFGNGDLNTRVSVQSRGETALLEQGFNDLAAEIQTSRERMEAEIEQATSELQETLEAVEIQNVELDLARKRAEESNRIKSEFLANISHEIRTPMNAIFGYTQLLARTTANDSQKDYIQTIQRSAESLLALLEDVLNLSRIEAGRVEVDNNPFSPEALFEELITIMAPAAHEKGLDLLWCPESPLPSQVHGDAVKLRQIVSNLLSNACKFTDQGSVSLKARVESKAEGRGWLVVKVEDTGIGIRDSDLPRLFQAFTQLDSSSSRRHQGAGLGLVICDQLSRLMGGNIHVDSQAGVGSTFSVHIPLDAIEHADGNAQIIPPILVQAQDKSIASSLAGRLTQIGGRILEPSVADDKPGPKDAGKGDDAPLLLIGLSRREVVAMIRGDASLPGLQKLPEGFRTSVVLASTQDSIELESLRTRLGAPCLPMTCSRSLLEKTIAAAKDEQADTLPVALLGEEISEQSHLSGLRLMVVEDNRINRHLTTEFLESAGASVRAAVDGHDALDIAAQWKPDAVLMDIQLPDMDGLETSQRLRKGFGYDRIPILALTASASEEEHRRCLRGGLDAVLVKPVRAETLISRVRRAIEDYAEETPTSETPETTLPRKTSRQPMGRDASGKLRADIADMVASDLPSQLSTARTFLEKGDLKGLDSEVHTIKGTAAFCGFPDLQAACEAIRLAIAETRANPDGHLETLMETLEREAQQVLDELKG